MPAPLSIAAFWAAKSPVDGGTVDSLVTFARQFQGSSRVEVMIGILNGFDQNFAMAGDANTSQRQLTQQRRSKRVGFILRPVATHLQ
jgi:hypothetical protein